MSNRLPGDIRQPPPRTEELARVAQGSALVFIATIFGLGLNYLFSIWVARALGATEFGVYAIGLAVFNILSVFALGGLDSATLKFVPAAQASGVVTRVRHIIRVLLGLSLLFGTVIGLALLVGAPVFAGPLFNNEQVTSVLMLFGIGIPAYTMSFVLLTTLQALKDIVRPTMIRYVCEPIARNLIAIVLLWIGWGANGAAMAVVVALMITALLAAWVLQSRVPQGHEPSSGGVATAQILELSSHLIVALFFNAFAARSDMLILGHYRPTADVGIYSAAFLTSSILTLALGCFESMANPLFSQHIAHANMTQLAGLYRTILRWSLIVALPLFLVMAFFPTVILSAFGSTYESGAAALAILALGQIVNAATASTHNVLVLAGHSKVVMWNGIGMGVLQIGLNLFLIPPFGILGAAIATATVSITVNIVRLVEARILLQLTAYDRKIWKPLFAACASSMLAFVGESWLGQSALQLFLLMGLVVVTYYGILMLIGLSREDRDVITQSLAKARSYFGKGAS
jgi:O-antigen/teichoic acid export membrane protein